MAKIRNGFVSNSSSSSFIIATNQETPKITITFELDDLAGTPIANKEDLEKQFLERYGYETMKELLSDDAWLKEKYETCLALITKGHKVYFGSVSSDDYDGNSAFFYSHGFGTGLKNFQVIQDID